MNVQNFWHSPLSVRGPASSITAFLRSITVFLSIKVTMMMPPFTVHMHTKTLIFLSINSTIRFSIHVWFWIYENCFRSSRPCCGSLTLGGPSSPVQLFVLLPLVRCHHHLQLEIVQTTFYYLLQLCLISVCRRRKEWTQSNLRASTQGNN